MHYSTCSCSTLPLPRPATKNHLDVYLPLAETDYGKNIGTGLAALFFNTPGVREQVASAGSLFGMRTDGLWCMDGIIYFSIGGITAKFNPNTFHWEEKIWKNTPSSLYGRYIWTDGIDVYYSYDGTASTDPDYRLNKATDTWEVIKTTKPDHFFSMRIWTDGIDTYYSDEFSQKVWNRSKREWIDMTWYGDLPKYFQGFDLWKDINGDIYYSGYASDERQTEGGHGIASPSRASTWRLDIPSKTWTEAPQYTSTGEPLKITASEIWYDGALLRYSSYRYSSNTIFLERRADGLWYPIPNITGAAALGSGDTANNHSIRSFYGDGFWSDGVNIFYSSDNEANYGILLPTNSKIYIKAAGTWYKIGDLAGVAQLMLAPPEVSRSNASGEIIINNPAANYKKVIYYNVYKADGTYVRKEYFSDDSQIITGLTGGTAYQISAVGTDGTESEKSISVTPL